MSKIKAGGNFFHDRELQDAVEQHLLARMAEGESMSVIEPDDSLGPEEVVLYEDGVIGMGCDILENLKRYMASLGEQPIRLTDLN